MPRQIPITAEMREIRGVSDDASQPRLTAERVQAVTGHTHEQLKALIGDGLFPDPVMEIEGRQFFDEAEVNNWLTTSGRAGIEATPTMPAMLRAVPPEYAN